MCSYDVRQFSGVATGWGFTKDRGHPSDELLKVQLNIISNERCNEFYQRFQALKDGIIDTQLCAGHDFEDKDTCNGDSGELVNFTDIFSINRIINMFNSGGPRGKSQKIEL